MVLASRCGSARIAEYWDHFQAIPALKIDLFIARNELVQKHSNQPFAVGSTRLSIVKELDKINIIEGMMLINCTAAPIQAGPAEFAHPGLFRKLI
jgi:hypothetical protein